jgi:hypothetical protein
VQTLSRRRLDISSCLALEFKTKWYSVVNTFQAIVIRALVVLHLGR